MIVLNNIKILMLTAKDTDRDKMIAKDIFKADEYITKPFEFKNLLSGIEILLQTNE